MIGKIEAAPERGTGRISEVGDLPRDTSTLAISQGDLVAVVQAVARVSPDWVVYLSQPFHDETNLVVSPRDVCDDVRPSLVIYQDCDGFHLDQVQWNVCSTIGVYPSLADAVHVMMVHLTRAAELRAELDHPDPP